MLLQSEPPDPGCEEGDLRRPPAGRDDRAEVHEGVSLGVPAAVPAPAAADRDLHLHHRLEPVDVGTLEQADLDETHGSARIATAASSPTYAAARRLPVTQVQSDIATRTPPGASVDAAELAALRAHVMGSLPAFLADLERLSNIDCGSYSPDGVNEVATWTAAALEAVGAS